MQMCGLTCHSRDGNTALANER